MRFQAVLAALPLALACSPGTPAPPASSLSDATYCEAATDPAATLHAGVITRCERDRGEHGESAADGCVHRRIDGAGLIDVELEGVTDVLVAPDGAMVVRYEGGRLGLRRGDEERELAAWSADPSLVGHRLAYLAVPAGVPLDEDGAPPAGAPLDVVLHPLDGGPEVVAQDDTASDPFALPDGGGVIFTSTRTGLASVWLARPGVPSRQVTNVGLETAGQAFVPAPHRELVWRPGTTIAVFTARYDDDRVVELDVESGEARVLGPGRMPLVDGDAVRVAVPGADCARRVPAGGGA